MGMARRRQYRQSTRSALDRVEAACGLEAPEAAAREVAVAALGCLEEICRDLGALRQQGGWMTLDEAERYAHVGEGALREAARAGELRCYQRREYAAVVVAASDVDEWIRRTWRDRSEFAKEA